MKIINYYFACWLIAATLSLQCSSASAQYLSERLVPPQQVTLPPIPMVGQPTEPSLFGAERPRSHLWTLPFGSFPGAMMVLPTEQRAANWKRPALDVPGLTSEADPTRPTFPVQPIAPRVYAMSPNPAQSPTLARFPLPNEPLVLASEDPGAIAAFSVLTASVPLAMPNSIPLLRLSIPDPFEQIRTIRLSNSPADLDDPVTAQDRPPLSKLPQIEPPK